MKQTLVLFILCSMVFSLLAQVTYPALPPCGNQWVNDETEILATSGDRVIYSNGEFVKNFLILDNASMSEPDTLLADARILYFQENTPDLLRWAVGPDLFELKPSDEEPVLLFSAPDDIVEAEYLNGTLYVAYERVGFSGRDEIVAVSPTGDVSDVLYQSLFGGISGLEAHGSNLFALSNDTLGAVLVNVGLAPGTSVVIDSMYGPASFISASPPTTRFQTLGDQLVWFYPSPNESSTWDMWGSDGTAAGTQKLESFASDPFGFAVPPVAFDGELYVFYRLNTSSQGSTFEAIKTDGTISGTVNLSTNPNAFANATSVAVGNGYLYYSTREQGLRRSNSSIATTEPGLTGSAGDFYVGRIGFLGDKLYINGTNDFNNFELYRVNGNSYSSIELIEEFIPGTADGGFPVQFTAGTNQLFFLTQTVDSFEELYVHDLSRATPLIQRVSVDDLILTPVTDTDSGEVEIIAQGQGLSFQLDTGIVQTSNIFTIGETGTYTFTVRDTFGCERSGTFIIEFLSSTNAPSSVTFDVWPNILSSQGGNVTVSSKEPVESVKLIDVNGRELKEWKLDNRLSTVELPRLNAGVYHLFVSSRNGSMYGVRPIFVSQ